MRLPHSLGLPLVFLFLPLLLLLLQVSVPVDHSLKVHLRLPLVQLLQLLQVLQHLHLHLGILRAVLQHLWRGLGEAISSRSFLEAIKK